MRTVLGALLALALCGPAAAQALVEKQVFAAGDYRTRAGATIPNVRVGYQIAGKLNAAGDNAVLINHFFSGNAQAWGRYVEGGPVGYWDAIIGPGRAIDTDKFFVVASDSLVNLNVPDSRTTTTGPASVDPGTGKPYGMRFPVVSMRDFIEVQKKLLDGLGVKRLAMVGGASMGAMQTMEWAAAYPAMIDRVMTVIGAEIDPWMIAWLDVWEAPIRLDPAWRNGDYYGGEPPVRGLAEALKIITLQSRDPEWAATLGRGPASGEDPAQTAAGRFAIEKWLDDASAARAKTSDANSLLYLARANQLFLNEYPSQAAALERSPQRWLVLPSLNDRVFLIENMRAMVATLEKQGKRVSTADLVGPLGHLNGVVGMGAHAARVAAFLAE